MNNSDKIYGTILGHALGDALGAPHEFYPYGFYTGKLKTPITRYSRYFGKQISSVGQITDDTEMAFILMSVLSSGYTKEKAVIEYMHWANNRPLAGNSPFMGKNTRSLFVIGKSSIPKMSLYESRFKKTFPNEKKKEDARSNGSMMRFYPLAFVEPSDLSKIDNDITNPSKVTFECVDSYLTAIRMAIAGETKENIKSKIKSLLTHKETKEAFEKACNNTFVDVTVMRGYVVHAFYCAFWGLFNFDDYKSAIDAIICLGPKENEKAKIFIKHRNENLKKGEVKLGDTDTNAAIAGALLGSFYGLKKIKENEITKQNLKILLHCDPNKGDIKRPEKYILSTKNLKKLASFFIGLHKNEK